MLSEELQIWFENILANISLQTSCLVPFYHEMINGRLKSIISLLKASLLHRV